MPRRRDNRGSIGYDPGVTIAMGQPVCAASEADFAAARGICRRSGGSLYFLSSFLPGRKRRAAWAVFAFAQMTRDVLLETQNDPEAAGNQSYPSGIGAAGSVLQLFHARLDQIYSGRIELVAAAERSNTERALAAFAQTAQRFEIPQQQFINFAEGCRLQLSTARFPTWASVQRYIDLIGGSISLALSCVLGVTNSESSVHALNMARAICLANILCNLRADAKQGRIFLPLEDLARFRYSEKDLLNFRVNESFRELMKFQLDRARRFHAEASKGVCWLAGDSSKLAVSSLALTYDLLLNRIERRGYDVFNHPPVLSRRWILRTLPAAWRLARRGPE